MKVTKRRVGMFFGLGATALLVVACRPTFLVFNAWLQDGHMSHYGIYLNHDETGVPWGSFVMLEYTDLTGFGSREVAKLKAKAGLSHESSDYSLLNDTSESFRNEGPVMVADVILKKN